MSKVEYMYCNNYLALQYDSPKIIFDKSFNGDFWKGTLKSNFITLKVKDYTEGQKVIVLGKIVYIPHPGMNICPLQLKTGPFGDRELCILNESRFDIKEFDGKQVQVDGLLKDQAYNPALQSSHRELTVESIRVITK